MEQPRYLRRLLNQKILLIIGVVVAIAAGLLAGFTVKDGQIESRVVRTYTASSTVLLSSSQPNYLQVEIPGTTQALPQPSDTAAPAPEVVVTEATPVNLSSSAIILAYLAASDEVVDTVASEIGGLEEGDAVTAVRRTTQPAGDEEFGGRLELPIIDIIGVSTSPDRAELIAAEATSVFSDIVVREQTQWGVPEDVRLVLDEVNEPVAGEGEGSNPAIPIIVVALGVLLFFIALALVIEAIREGRRRRRIAADDVEAEAAEPTTDAEPDAEEHDRRDDDHDRSEAELDTVMSPSAEESARRSSRRRSHSEEPTDRVDTLLSEHDDASTSSRS
jgi:hypothetical protein